MTRAIRTPGAAVATPTLCGPRVVLRPWVDADRAPFAALNADAEVMRHMSRTLDADESAAMAERIRSHFQAHGYGLWALDVPAFGVHGLGFAGFVGLSATLPFALDLPGIVMAPREIGWRLARAAWGHGFATEAAQVVLQHAFEVLRLPQVVSYTAVDNSRSRAVMERLGLTWRHDFAHPLLPAEHRSRRQVLYAKDAP